MGLANPSNQYHQQHQPSYGQHAYGTGKTRAKQEGSITALANTVFRQLTQHPLFQSQVMVKIFLVGIISSSLKSPFELI